MLDAVNETICENLCKIMSAKEKRRNHNITEKRALRYTVDDVGQSPYLWRKAKIKGL